MEIFKVKISSKGQIAIPKKIRERLATDLLSLTMIDDKVILTPTESVLSIGAALKSYAQNASQSDIRSTSDAAWESHVKEKFGSD